MLLKGNPSSNKCGTMDNFVLSAEDCVRYQKNFQDCNPIAGYVPAAAASQFFLRSSLPKLELAKIWELSDVTKDGQLDLVEFCIAMHLIRRRVKGVAVPDLLPASLHPNVVKMVCYSTSSANAAVIPSPMITPMQSGGGVSSVSFPASVNLSAPSSVISSMQNQWPNNLTTQIQQVFAPPSSTNAYPMGVPPTNVMQYPVSSAPVSQSYTTSTLPSSAAIPKSPYVAYIPPPGVEWGIPQPSRLRYNQVFHQAISASTSNDPHHLTASQAKSILMKSGLETSTLAQIWNLSDLGCDGMLSQEEFNLAMYLTEEAKKGAKTPDILPPELVTPSYRKWWHEQAVLGRPLKAEFETTGAMLSNLPHQMKAAYTGGSLASASELEGDFSGLTIGGQPVSFEDKRRENFSKGQAELERRREQLREADRREKEEQMRREQAIEAERERLRMESERRAQEEMEKKMQQWQEQKEQYEEAKRKREAAMLESERQQYIEILNRRKQELTLQKQKLHGEYQNAKAKLKTCEADSEEEGRRHSTLTEQLENLQNSAKERKGIIDGMREIRDSTMSQIDAFQREKNELQGKLNYLKNERAALTRRKGALEHQDAVPDSLRSFENSVSCRTDSLSELKSKLVALESNTQEKLEAIDEHNNRMGAIQSAFEDLFRQNTEHLAHFSDLSKSLKKRSGRFVAEEAVPPPPQLNNTPTLTTQSSDEHGVYPATHKDSHIKRYRAVYAFHARNTDELSFDIGDIILVPSIANQDDPGWLAGTLERDSSKKGWLPANHVELETSDSSSASQTSKNLFFEANFADTQVAPTSEPTSANQQAFASTTTNTSSASKSWAEDAWATPKNFPPLSSTSSASSTNTSGAFTKSSGATTTTTAAATTNQNSTYSMFPPEAFPDANNPQVNTTTKIGRSLYPWTAKKDNHATFGKGEMIVIKKQVGGWCYGEPRLTHKEGWFPAAYVTIVQESQAPQVSSNTHTTGPEVIAQCVAEYDFSSDVDGDLNFKAGQSIYVTKKDAEWWSGYVVESNQQQRAGIFPGNFVKLVREGSASNSLSNTPTPFLAHSTSASTTSRSGSPFDTVDNMELCQAIAPFKAAGPEQLSLEKGDVIAVRQRSPNGWWEGEVRQKLDIRTGVYRKVDVIATTTSSSSEAPKRKGHRRKSSGSSTSSAAVERKWGWFPGNFVKPFSASNPPVVASK